MFAATIGLTISRPAISRPTGTDAEQTHYRDCVLQSRRDPEKAYNQALEWHKNGGGGASRHCAALALVGMGRYEDAATVLEELADDVQISDTATRIGAKSGDALRAALLSQAGNAWLMAKQFRSARATLTKALKYVDKRSPSACDILIDRARASAGEKNFDRALNDLDEALDIDPTRPEIYVYRASAWRETNQMDLASKDIERALQMEPGDVDALLERGYIRQRQDNLSGARDDWQKVIDSAPGSPQAEQAAKNLKTLEPGPAPKSSDQEAPESSHSAATAGSGSPSK
ncbi:MAG TPA: tetratricopeptide repeat protein [Alphaproteobacteria bacterium]|nr:tetratricopeptide repeat protein [Alphaproteobacteria bacterium]